MKPTRTRPMQRRTGLLLILIALPLVVMLFTATNASAQVCASLNLTTQAQVDAASCSSVTGKLSIIGATVFMSVEMNLMARDYGVFDGSFSEITTRPLDVAVDAAAAVVTIVLVVLARGSIQRNLTFVSSVLVAWAAISAGIQVLQGRTDALERPLVLRRNFESAFIGHDGFFVFLLLQQIVTVTYVLSRGARH